MRSSESRVRDVLRSVHELEDQVYSSGLPGLGETLKTLFSWDRAEDSEFEEGSLLLVDRNPNKVAHAEEVFGEPATLFRLSISHPSAGERLALLLSLVLPRRWRHTLGALVVAKNVLRRLPKKCRVALFNPYFLTHYAVAEMTTVDKVYHLSPEYPRVRRFKQVFANRVVHEIYGYPPHARCVVARSIVYRGEFPVVRIYLSQLRAVGRLPEERALLRLARRMNAESWAPVEIFLHYLDRELTEGELCELGIDEELQVIIRRANSLEYVSQGQISFSATSTIGYDLLASDVNHFIFVDRDRPLRGFIRGEAWVRLREWRDACNRVTSFDIEFDELLRVVRGVNSEAFVATFDCES